ncbi:APC family permease [Pimelobacter simplex]|uniref:APC family permease n=1 Tax=Nocardioides simplex TaxID=2045 RepID=UPI00214F8000|nr:APC family permease [Pimelobacter simplex]UUW92432.1 APC family permease [Pimelobacter simplex]UUW96260.1 APC family permease [Pimelobacter simplex]
MAELDPHETPAAGMIEDNPSPEGPARYEQQLARSLTMRENIMITLSSVTPASSVFIIVPAILLGVGGASVLTLALAAVAAVLVGVCYAELSATYPVTGGEYTWAARLLGRPAGFATFLLTLVSGILIIAVIALGTGDYLGAAWSGLSGSWVGVAVIVVTTAVAALDIRTNAWVTGLFLATEVLALIVLAVLGFLHPERGIATFFSAQTMGAHGLEGVGVAAVVALLPVALFAFNGYGAAVYYVEETKDANRTIGRVILVALAVTALVEIVPLAAVVVGAPSMEALLASDAPMNYFLLERGGSALNVVISVGIALAIVNAVIAIIIQIARLVYASARDRSWPGPVDDVLGRIHPRFKSPVNATLLVGGVAALAAALIPLSWLITATGASVAVVYLVVGTSALRLRRPGLARSRGYRMPWWPLPPLLLIAGMVYVCVQVARDTPSQLAISLTTMVLGLVYYLGFIHPRRGERWTLPDPVEEEGTA